MPKISPFDFGEHPLNIGVAASVNCLISEGDSPLEITWQLNGNVLKPDSGMEISKIGKRLQVLSIESVESEHVGNYTCRAENAAGYDEVTAWLAINGSQL